MAVELLIYAKTDNPKIKKGSIQTVREAPGGWGTRELPEFGDFILLTISDATVAQVENYMDRWKLEFSYDGPTNMGGSNRRLDVSIDPRLQAKYPTYTTNLGINIKNALLDRFAAQVQSVTFPNAYTFRVDYAQGGGIVNKMKNHLVDLFSDDIEDRYWRFSEADIDLAVSAGGYVTLDRAAALLRLRDARDD